MARRRWWHPSRRRRGAFGAIFSGADDLFHGTAKQAQEIRQEEKQLGQAIESEDGTKKIRVTIENEALPKQE